MFNTPLIEDKLAMRVNFSLRDRDGIVEEIGGPTGDVDGLGTDNGAIQFKWTPTEDLEFNYRQNFLKVDRSFGGANGAGLVVLNEGGENNRITDALVPGYRFIDTNNTDPANYLQNNFYDSSKPILTFNHPVTGAVGQALLVRLYIIAVFSPEIFLAGTSALRLTDSIMRGLKIIQLSSALHGLSMIDSN
ncbi:MAG: hypothetical protein ISQ56_08980 [Pseudomonadales bacterium]|nr:hypothetical protein [Pseudomonadales bacterium]